MIVKKNHDFEKYVFNDSSPIEWVSHDNDTNEMGIGFISGDIYIYYKVPYIVFRSFVDSNDKMTFLNNFIKGSFKEKIIKNKLNGGN